MFYFGTGTGIRFGTYLYIFNIKDFFSNKISQKVKVQFPFRAKLIQIDHYGHNW